MIQKIFRHIKNRTVGFAVRTFIKRVLGQEISTRFNILDQKDAIPILLEQAKRWLSTNANKTVIFITDESSFSKKLENCFSQNGINLHTVPLNMLGKLSSEKTKNAACIIAGFLNPKELTKLGIYLAKHPQLSEIPFEFSIIPKDSYETILKHDHEKSINFISPLLYSDIDYFRIYESSLLLFEKKCQIRDYMDLCQLLQGTFERNVEGEIAEFGSWKGHSGHLISEIMQKNNCKKQLYMFDMFEEFPQENVGLDAFWNKTHTLDFEEVKAKFKTTKNVTLVKGDFTQTFVTSKIQKLCFVYIDCDSYRGTKYLLNTIYDKYLSRGGAIVLEDYGNGPLLGTRVAFHEFFDDRKDCFKLFSQFSGHEIILKY